MPDVSTHAGPRPVEEPPGATIAPGRLRVTAGRILATPLSRARAIILLALIALTVASWWYLVRAGADMNDHHAMSPTMGAGVVLFLAVWVVMIAAMMFPAVAPMVLMFARIAATRRTAGKSFAPTWLFVLGYVALWTGLGFAGFVLASGGERLAAEVSWVDDNVGRIGGVLIVVAGVYQLSKLKDRCLTVCRSPMAFVMTHWREGRIGAFRMGLHHGWDCAGCCWALMALMFPLGMMNVAALAAVTAVIYAEKVLPSGQQLGRAVGVALLVLGLAVIAKPDLLPGEPTGSDAGHQHSVAG